MGTPQGPTNAPREGHNRSDNTRRNNGGHWFSTESASPTTQMPDGNSPHCWPRAREAGRVTHTGGLCARHPSSARGPTQSSRLPCERRCYSHVPSADGGGGETHPQRTHEPPRGYVAGSGQPGVGPRPGHIPQEELSISGGYRRCSAHTVLGPPVPEPSSCSVGGTASPTDKRRGAGGQRGWRRRDPSRPPASLQGPRCRSGRKLREKPSV